jgi:hypothetical protein
MVPPVEPEPGGMMLMLMFPPEPVLPLPPVLALPPVLLPLPVLVLPPVLPLPLVLLELCGLWFQPFPTPLPQP